MSHLNLLGPFQYFKHICFICQRAGLSRACSRNTSLKALHVPSFCPPSQWVWDDGVHTKPWSIAHKWTLKLERRLRTLEVISSSCTHYKLLVDNYDLGIGLQLKDSPNTGPSIAPKLGPWKTSLGQGLLMWQSSLSSNDHFDSGRATLPRPAVCSGRTEPTSDLALVQGSCLSWPTESSLSRG